MRSKPKSETNEQGAKMVKEKVITKEVIGGEVITKLEELEESLRQAQKIDQGFYEELLEDYFVYVRALKSVDDSYPWLRAIDIQEEHSEIRARLPNVSEDEFEVYIHLGNLLAILFK